MVKSREKEKKKELLRVIYRKGIDNFEGIERE